MCEIYFVSVQYILLKLYLGIQLSLKHLLNKLEHLFKSFYKNM